jgi:hypothetical protein
VKKSIQWYLAWGIMVASLPMLFFTVTAGSAQAWTQESNSWGWDSAQWKYVGDPFCSATDQKTLDPNYPCLYWQEPVNTSIDTWYYMDPSLQTQAQATGGGLYNFLAAAEQAMAVWNGAPAYNPYMNVWSSGDPTFGGSVGMAAPYALQCDVLGLTTIDQISAVYGPITNAYWGDNEYVAFIEDTVTVFNHEASWNSNDNYTGDCFTYQNADGVAVALHEFGHVMGLGHTANPAVMYQGPNIHYMGYHTLQNDDTSGIFGIYPGDQPDSVPGPPYCCPP